MMETESKSNEIVKLVPIDIDNEVLDNREIFNFQNQMESYENDAKPNIVVSDGALLDNNMNMNDSDGNKIEKKPKKVLKLNIKKENSIKKLKSSKVSQFKKTKKPTCLNLPREENIKGYQIDQDYQNAFNGFVSNSGDLTSEFNSSKFNGLH